MMDGVLLHVLHMTRTPCVASIVNKYLECCCEREHTGEHPLAEDYCMHTLMTRGAEGW